MVVEFSVWPMVGPSVSQHVAKVVKLVDESGLNYKLNAMGTVVEGDWDEVMGLIKKCHQLLAGETERVITNISIDDRKGRTQRIAGKVESIEKILGKEVKK
jgi:uncharacterized protein (TIGR00106 family)